MEDYPRFFIQAQAIWEQRKGIPLFLCPVSAGWPSPAIGYVEKELDVHQYVVRNAPATFFVPVRDDSMIGAGIFAGDLLVVDTSLKSMPRRIVAAAADGEFMIRRIKKQGHRHFLMPENPDYEALEVTERNDARIWGVVTHVVRSLLKPSIPLPAYLEENGGLDLEELLVRNPHSTFFFLRAGGVSMLGAGIHEGDTLVVDKSLEALPGRVVIASVDDEFTMKRLKEHGGRSFLVPENPKYQPIEITTRDDARIWGVVTYALHAA